MNFFKDFMSPQLRTVLSAVFLYVLAEALGRWSQNEQTIS